MLNILKLNKEIKFGDACLFLTCHIGLTTGRVFAGEIGERQGRREFNVMGNMVNTAARLMDYAGPGQIIASEAVYEEIKELYETEKLEDVPLKGRSSTFTLYEIGKDK